jgi:catechol 2,3-dioxygenase-like lactoylglutathione lyase family enzyme
VSTFAGFDHIDVRVRALRSAEPFYDQLLYVLGLTVKRPAYVDPAGEWVEPPEGVAYNVAEYYETPQAGVVGHFIGIIEDAGMTPTATRIAFRLPPGEPLEPWFARLLEFGAQRVEMSADLEGYPAIFFEDPCGTRLELCARRPKKNA